MSEQHLITVGHIWRLAELVPVLSKTAEMKFILLKLRVSFRTNNIDNNQTTNIFLNYYSNNSVLPK